MLTLNQLLRDEGIDPDRVYAIRHNAKNDGVRACLDAGMIREYTGFQSRGEFVTAEREDCRLWLTFVGDDRETRLHAVYRFEGASEPYRPGMEPDGYPAVCTPGEDDRLYPLEESDALAEYEGRLTVEWDSNINYVRRLGPKHNDFPVTSLASAAFPGYDTFIADHRLLADMRRHPDRYSEWIRALSAVQAIYLILEPVDGGLYVGSATGGDGLWGRWSEYAKDEAHGGNVILRRMLGEHPERRDRLQYSILAILDPKTGRNRALELEEAYKRKLGSRAIGLNDGEPDYIKLNAN